ncbi:MAG TPA: NYN domain-containing protein [Terrimesophilobacter sp.]|nr:NYN domain-containing protein [Terrimesophilobacter sp.]
MAVRPVANVYTDGFNLYYGALKNTPYKWLNVRHLCELVLPEHDIGKISYFTARVKARPDDPQAPARQQAYLSALGSIPPMDIVFGQFFVSNVRMPVANSLTNPRTVEVVKTEEKGSAVNLAAHLLLDAFRREADLFAVVSNDSDLTEPLRIVREELGRNTALVNPHKSTSRSLLRCHPSLVRQIRQGALSASQFPHDVILPGGRTVHKPGGW